jgi:hypothetical protein
MNNIRFFIASTAGLSLFLMSFMLHADRPSWEQFSQGGSLKVIIQPEAEQYQIGQYHKWMIIVKDLSGNPVENASITVAGGMLGHGHGLPSQPVVTKQIENGSYIIVGSDSFYVLVDGAPAVPYLWDTGLHFLFSPTVVTNRGDSGAVTLNLGPGEHVVTFYLREDGTQLSGARLNLIQAF